MTADLFIVAVVAAGTLAMRASMITLLADVTIPPRVEQALGLVAADLVKLHPVKPRLGFLQAQLMFARFGLCQIEAARLKHAAALAGLILMLPSRCPGTPLRSVD